MRRHFGLIATIGLALLILIGLSLAGNVELYQEGESELAPKRSSFNAGPTGTRAFYQLLEESGQRVNRWRERFSELKNKAPNGILILVGPFPNDTLVTDDDLKALQQWIEAGGRALVVSRAPQEQLGSHTVVANPPSTAPDAKATAEQIVNTHSDELFRQPTSITRDLHGLALSGFAARIVSPSQPEDAAQPAASVEIKPEASDTAAPPTPSPTPSPTTTTATPISDDEIESLNALDDLFILPTPVVHLGDDKGAVLADYDYGKGRLIVLTDPFVIANHGLARGGNLQLARNLLRELGAAARPLLFDEYHHGYRSETNGLIGYFRGTPFWWALGQILLLSGLVIVSLGKRFARPLPLPQTDRHSPLEFVSSMASLQQAAAAHDLALENIYPKFKARLCRRLGLSLRARTDDIADALRASPRFAPFAERLLQVMQTSEQGLKGAALTDAQLIETVRAIRTLNTEMK